MTSFSLEEYKQIQGYFINWFWMQVAYPTVKTSNTSGKSKVYFNQNYPNSNYKPNH